jgi:chromate transporter
MRPHDKIDRKENHTRALFEVLGAAAKLGLTSFGGPIAHIGYFHEE